jgi:hypothetical protein
VPWCEGYTGRGLESNPRKETSYSRSGTKFERFFEGFGVVHENVRRRDDSLAGEKRDGIPLMYVRTASCRTPNLQARSYCLYHVAQLLMRTENSHRLTTGVRGWIGETSSAQRASQDSGLMVIATGLPLCSLYVRHIYHTTWME